MWGCLGLDRTTERRIARRQGLTGFLRDIECRTTTKQRGEQQKSNQGLFDSHGAYSGWWRSGNAGSRRMASCSPPAFCSHRPCVLFLRSAGLFLERSPCAGYCGICPGWSRSCRPQSARKTPTAKAYENDTATHFRIHLSYRRSASARDPNAEPLPFSPRLYMLPEKKRGQQQESDVDLRQDDREWNRTNDKHELLLSADRAYETQAKLLVVSCSPRTAPPVSAVYWR